MALRNSTPLQPLHLNYATQLIRTPFGIAISGAPRPELIAQPAEAAKAAGLRYVSDAIPGIRRKRSGRGFVYLDPHGKPLRDPDSLARIRSLVVPPAWTNVWICPKCYIHPEIVNAYLDGTMVLALKGRAEKALIEDVHRLRPEEAAVLGLLQQRLQHEATQHPRRARRKLRSGGTRKQFARPMPVAVSRTR